MIAETARLMTELGLKDGLSPGPAKVRSELSAANAASAKTGAGLLNLGKVTSGASAAFGTFRGRLGQLAGATGLVGLGAGLFSVIGLIEKGVHQAEDFGAEVYKLQAVTGLSAEKTSELAAAFHHFGIESDTALRIAGFAEKNIFAQGETAKKTAAFLKTYGFELRDASGHLKDFNTLLLDEADYFNNKHIPAATKDAELAKIFGRNWQALIPILKGGRAALRDAEVEATRLGLTLTGSNLAALAKLREATRSWSTALGGLELQIGLALVPMLTKFTTAATAFVSKNRGQIVGFFKSLGDFAQNAADVIAHQVIPTISGIYGAWMKIPADLRNFVIRGLIADRTVKFLFGFSPIKFAAESLTTVIGKIVGQFAANKLVPQMISAVAPIPVFVTNPGFGGPGGLPGAAAGEGTAAADVGAGLLGGGSLASVAAAAAAGGALILGLGAFFALTVPEGQGYKRPGPRMTGTGPSDPLGYGPKGQIRGPAGTASDPLHVTDPKQLAANTAAAQHLYNLSTSAKKREAGPLPGLTSKQFLSDLARTSFIGAAGYKSIFEAFSTFRGSRGADPTGQGFLELVKRLQNPKAPQVMFEIKGHLAELANLEKYYLAHGDVTNAAKVQGVINQVDRLIGVTQTQLPALVAAMKAQERQQGAVAHQAIVQSSKMDRLNSLVGATAGNTAIVARKNFSPHFNPTFHVPIYTTNNFNVNSLASSLVSTYTRVNVGNQYQGKALPGF